MKIFTNKGFKKRIQWARELVESEYKIKATILNLISSYLNTDLSKMSVEELQKFFNFNPNRNARMLDFLEGADAGIDSIIYAYEKCGLARKHTLEKLRFRAKKNIQDRMEEYKEKLNGEQ